MKISNLELRDVVKKSNLFARMFPEAKLKLIEALKENNEIVAMTGDGVNDGPAIKAAHIGIAMGKKGTEVARQAADLIITDDDLGKIAEAIVQGRRIFSNLKKAVRYIISIHIPIILTASLPLIIGWKYPNIFTPIHVIFLELIMGPTCSIFYEREPAEQNIMQMKPRSQRSNIFNRDELLISIVQGLIITCGVLGLYYFYMLNSTLEETRTIVFISLVCSNVFLTFTNRSFTETIIKTSRYKNSLVFPILIISIALILILLFFQPVREVFGMQLISMQDFFICLLTSFVSVFWFEAYKANLKEVI
jgi:Ca2+-transporting ATPase